MTDNVVALPGHSIRTAYGEPVVAIVEQLRDLLAKAEGGQVVGLSVAAVLDDGTASPMVYVPPSHADRHSFTLVAASVQAHRSLTARIFDE